MHGCARAASYRHKIKTAEELRAIDRPAAAQEEGDHVPRHLRRRASGPHPPPAVRQEQGRHPGRQPHRATRTSRRPTIRPFVPQELRAINLAALEMVDYVVIDREPDAAREHLRCIQPDYFAKGYEYTAGGMHPKTQEEIDVARELRRRDHLHARATSSIRPRASSSSRRPTSRSRSCMMLHGGRGHRPSTTCATRSTSFTGVARPRRRRHHRRQLHLLQHDRRHDQDADHERALRAAGSTSSAAPAIVAKHLRAAGAEVTFSTVLGDDALQGFRARRTWKQPASRCQPIIDPTRPTTNKNAIVAGGYRLLKVDTLDNRSISDKIADAARSADRRDARPTSWCSAISATASSTARPSRA